MRIWYKDYLQEQATGIMHVRWRSPLKHTEQQRQAAIEHYLSHGRCLVRTILALGYPGRTSCPNGDVTWCQSSESSPEMRYNSLRSRKRTQ